MSSEMSDLLYKHRAIERAAESEGIDLVHYDEYTVDDDGVKAWRTEPDSYFWTPSCVWDDHGNFMTPDDDIEMWIDWAKNDPARCLTSSMVKLDDLLELGFTFHPDKDDVNESGLHQGMDADPRKTYKELREQFPNSDFIFWLKEASQFYSTWQVLIRLHRVTISSNGFSHDRQVSDALDWLAHYDVEAWNAIVVPNSELRDIKWSGSWWDTEAMGVDDEMSSWIADELENTGFIVWEDGEPYGILN